MVTILILLVRITGAIDVNSVFHNPQDIFYADLIYNEFKLRSKKGNINKVMLISGVKQIKMDKITTDDEFDYFLGNWSQADTVLAYHFLLQDDNDSVRFPPAGEFRITKPRYMMPNWAIGKVYYSIFPDGFYDGNPANNPKDVVPWGKSPSDWHSYGGDLTGIVEKLPYLDSLDPDIIIIQPLFPAHSNHKFNPNNYSNIDQALGDTNDLKILIEGLHDQGRHVIMNFICTHTGIDFPAFADILENDTLSKYLKWYFIKSTPVRISADHYECWHADPQFPKLNLRNPDVQNYLLGYLEYWKHYGFDGFYIGDDEVIDTVFLKILNNTLKTRYPGLLLISSSSQAGYLDGITNHELAELLIKYFVTNTLTTSEFDSQIQRMLFLNTARVNCTNLTILSRYDTRVARETSLKNLYAFIFTFCGSPTILYGDEVGMSECAPLNPGSFAWDPRQQNLSLLEEIKRLISIRKQNPRISQKNFYTLYVNDINKVYAYDRGGLIVILNSDETPSFVKIPAWDGVYIDLMSGEKFTAESQTLKININAKSYRILKREI